MNELETLIMGVQRKLLVMYDDLDLSDLSSYNQVFILLVEESKGSAGGRGGGSGHRKIAQVSAFKIDNRTIEKIYDTKDENIIEKFEIPYSAIAIDIKLSDGREFVVQGVIDQELIKNYGKIIFSQSST
ncbi:MAG TPA: hypothetical protein VIS28_05830 [Nitrososphaeraceae archaeon]